MNSFILGFFYELLHRISELDKSFFKHGFNEKIDFNYRKIGVEKLASLKIKVQTVINRKEDFLIEEFDFRDDLLNRYKTCNEEFFIIEQDYFFVLKYYGTTEVYFQKIAVKKNNGESLVGITLETMRNLFLFSIVPFGILFFIGDELFAFVFGENWRQAGEYSQIMAPWLLLNFVVSPITQLPIVVGKLKSFFWIGLMGSLLLIGLFVFPHFNSNLSFATLLNYINYSQTIFLFFVMFWFIILCKK